ncbi:MAG: hypothetical protein ACYC9Y_16605 [Candidatus Methylomirabilia bacterium]
MGEHDLKPEEVHPDAGRRKLLKVVAAAGGAAAATFLLPGSWVKPVVELGVLPAGAQAAGSDVRVILDTQSMTTVPSNDTWALDARNAACDTTPRFVLCGSDGYHAFCNYNDPLGEFDPLNWTLFTRETPCNIVRSRLICGDGGGFYISGNLFCGSFDFYKLRECNSSTGLWWWVKKGDRSSNEVFSARQAEK